MTQHESLAVSVPESPCGTRYLAAMAILTPDQRLRVFISSTLGELAPERAVVRDVIERLRLRPVLFELGARPYAPRALYRAYLEQSNIFVGVYWERYGWIAEDMDISGLEDEYQLSSKLPRLLYIKEPAPEREPRLAAMLEQMVALADTTPKLFSSPAELAEMVADDLVLLLSERFSGRAHHAEEPVPDAQPAAEPLPVPLTSFVGRAREVADVQAMLQRDDVRMVTLAGMGGIGKTRLAMEVGRNLEAQFPDGVHLVRLASVTQPELVIPAIAAALGIRAEEKGAGDAGLLEAIAGRRLLLILDNFEQVTDAAPAIGQLLESAPELRVLVTSRRLLRLSAEHEYQVPTLSLPEDDAAARPEEIADADAVRLFIERAAAVRPEFRLTEDDAAAVAEIVRRLDGVPLAIELAAARIRLLPPAALLARLDRAIDVLSGGLADLPARQRSLRATLDWSFSLLTADEQDLFACLSTFLGGWTLEAAEAVCAADEVERMTVLDRLAALVDNSLVVVDLSAPSGGARFRMLEPVREYAREKLLAMDGHEEVDRRHLDYYERLTHAAGPQLSGRDQPAWLDRLEQEAGNLGVAALRLQNWGEGGRLVDLGWQTWIWIWLNDKIAEARHWLEPIQAQRATLEPVHRARLDWVLGALFFEHGHFDRAAPLLHRALAEFTELGDDEGRALSLMMTGSVLPYEGDDDLSTTHSSEAAELLRAQGNMFCASLALGFLGMHLVRGGELDKGQALIEQAVADVESINNVSMLAQLRLYQGFTAIIRGDLDRARFLFEDVIAADGGRRSSEVLAYAFDGLAGVALSSGDGARAVTLLGIAHGVRLRAAYPVWPDMQPVIDGLVAGAKQAIGDEEFEIAWQAGHSLPRAAAKTFALSTAAAETPAAD